jgi:DNA-binding IclR family transcriptional regulator
MGQSSGIGVLDKAVQVLDATAAAPLGLAELCASTGLPRATAHRLAVGLEVHGLLVRDETGRWRPGPRLAALATGGADPLVAAAAQVLPWLRDRIGESVQLYRRDGMSRVCVAVSELSSGLRTSVPLGARLPLTAGSGARVLVAWADRPTQEAVLAASVYPERALAEVRRRGWAESVAEREAGVASVSAPVRDGSGAVVAAVSVSGPVDRIGRRPGARWAGDLLEAAADLTAHLTAPLEGPAPG